MCLLEIYLEKNDLDTVKVILYDVFGCSIGVHNFILLKGGIKIFYIR